jgi:hypothetical protein
MHLMLLNYFYITYFYNMLINCDLIIVWEIKYVVCTVQTVLQHMVVDWVKLEDATEDQLMWK